METKAVPGLCGVLESPACEQLDKHSSNSVKGRSVVEFFGFGV